MRPETRQEIAARLVLEAESLVARQQDLVIYLARDGQDTDQGNRLLDSFEAALENFRRTRAALEAQTNGPSSLDRDTDLDRARDRMSKTGFRLSLVYARDAGQDADGQTACARDGDSSGKQAVLRLLEVTGENSPIPEFEWN